MAVQFALRDLHPEIQAAYRRAEEAAGSGSVEPVPHPELSPIAKLPEAAAETTIKPPAAAKAATRAPVTGIRDSDRERRLNPIIWHINTLHSP